MKMISQIFPLPAAGAHNLQHDRMLMPCTPDNPPDLQGREALALKRSLHRFPDEAVYVYCLKRRQLIYAAGFQDLLGFEDKAVTMGQIMSLTTPPYASFVHDIRQQVLSFLRAGHPDAGRYSFVIELKKFNKRGQEVPVLTRLSVLESADGAPKNIIGRIQLAPQLHFGNVVHYAVCGPDEKLLEAMLSRTQAAQPAISEKERQALMMVAAGAAFKEIGQQLGISHSAVEKRILPLYRRFGVRSLSHLVSYAYDHGILPCTTG